uniref:AbrB/MazE/SpoVT family DNA-binding domain-containing protein n=1 Tax=Ignisphaera aggregans TaxID=334771 RepID=A0A7C5UWC6_9CREN
MVRVDLTIPATLRLLLDIKEGEKLVLIFNEDSNKIEIYLPKISNTLLCDDEISKDILLELLRKFKVNAFKCRCIDNHCTIYRCKIFIELDEHGGESIKKLLKC